MSRYGTFLGYPYRSPVSLPRAADEGAGGDTLDGEFHGAQGAAHRWQISFAVIDPYGRRGIAGMLAWLWATKWRNEKFDLDEWPQVLGTREASGLSVAANAEIGATEVAVDVERWAFRASGRTTANAPSAPGQYRIVPNPPKGGSPLETWGPATTGFQFWDTKPFVGDAGDRLWFHNNFASWEITGVEQDLAAPGDGRLVDVRVQNFDYTGAGLRQTTKVGDYAVAGPGIDAGRLVSFAGHSKIYMAGPVRPPPYRQAAAGFDGTTATMPIRPALIDDVASRAAIDTSPGGSVRFRGQLDATQHSSVVLEATIVVRETLRP